MRFRTCEPPRTRSDWQLALGRWNSVGWVEIPSKDEPAIMAAWCRRMQPSKDILIPKPSRTWSLPDLSEDVEAEFTLKLLAAFRQCVKPGERLLVIDWQHTWYYLDPNGGIGSATRDEWAVPIIPDGDAYYYLAPDFRFGVITGWRRSGRLSIFGAELLAAFDAGTPAEFLRACGPGTTAPA